MNYSEVIAKARRDINKARLNDPAEHFPYKRSEAEAGNPDGWGIPSELAGVTESYVKAQEAYLKDSGDATYANYRRAGDELAEARRKFRIAEGRP